MVNVGIANKGASLEDGMTSRGAGVKGDKVGISQAAEESCHHQQTSEILGWDDGDAVEGCTAIVVIGKEPTGYNGRIVRINMTELLVGGEVSARSDGDMVTIGKKKDHGDEANCLLAKKELDQITIGIIRDGVVRDGETKVHRLVGISLLGIGTIGIVIVRCWVFAISGVFFGIVTVCNEFSLLGEAVTEIILGGREVVQFMVPVFIDKSGCMEESAGNVKGNGVDGFKRVTQKTGDDGLVVIKGFNGRGAEDLDETSVLKEDGGSL